MNHHPGKERLRKNVSRINDRVIAPNKHGKGGAKVLHKQITAPKLLKTGFTAYGKD